MIRIAPLNVDIFCQRKKFLTYNLVSRNLKIKYRRSFFGFFWSLLVPLGTASVYFVVFKLIMKIQIPNYLVYIISGILPWSFFSITLTDGMDSIVGNAPILTKVPVPLQIFPFVAAVTNYTTLLLSLPVLVAAMLFQSTYVDWSTFLFFYYICLLFFMAYSLSLILSIGYVYFRDLKHAFTIIIQLWFYATPVIYRDDMIPEHFRWLLILNPVGYIFTGIHHTLVNAKFPESVELLVPLVWTGLLFTIAVFATSRFSKGMVELL